MVAVHLSSKQLASLEGIVDGFMPCFPSNETRTSSPGKDSEANNSRFWNHRLSQDSAYMDALQLTITTKLEKKEKEDIKMLLTVLSTTVGSMLVTGKVSAQPFSAWETSMQSEALNSLKLSSIALKRCAFSGLKRLICGLALSFVNEDTNTNPFWEGIDYPGPLINITEGGTKKRVKEELNMYDFMGQGAVIDTSALKEQETIEYDCVIIVSFNRSLPWHTKVLRSRPFYVRA